MSPEPSEIRVRRNYFTPHVVFGLLLVAAGITLILDRLGVADAGQVFRFWPIALVLYGLSLVAQAIYGGTDATEGRRTGVFPFVLFMILALGFWGPNWRAGRRASIQGNADDRVEITSVLGDTKRVSYATAFQGGDVTAFMGGAELDFTHAAIAPGQEAVIDVHIVMGGAEMRVPDGWVVDVETVTTMGGVEDQRFHSSNAPTANAPAPRLVIRGSIIMGGLTVKS
jgi:hypothetical protein